MKAIGLWKFIFRLKSFAPCLMKMKRKLLSSSMNKSLLAVANWGLQANDLKQPIFNASSI